MGLRLRSASATDVGNVRTNNQDDLLILDDTLFAVADGMGGHASGEVASREVVETLRTTYEGVRSVDALRDAVRWANRAVFRKGIDEPLHAGMGTTLTAIAVVEDENLAVVNVGDSRTYLLREGRLVQLTIDHSFVQEAVRTGQLTREQAESHPRRSQLTRAMGIGDDVDVDIEPLTPLTGDRLLLCSDGLWDELPDDAIASILGRLEEPEAAAVELVRQAKEAGGRDNVTVVIVDVLDADETGRALAASNVLGESPTIAAPAPANASEIAVGADDDSHLLPSSPRSGPSPRLVTWRVILFVTALVGILVVAVLAVRSGADPWQVRFERGGTPDADQMVIAKGDRVERRTGFFRRDLLPTDAERVDRKIPAEDRTDAEAIANSFVPGIVQRRNLTTVPSTASTSTSTTAVTTTPSTAAVTTTSSVLGP